VGGTLLEFVVVPRGPGVGPRWLDGIIIVDGDHRIASRKERVSLDGHELIVVQAKAERVGMYLLGQALLSRLLLEDRCAPRSVRTVALCAIDDVVLRPFAKRFGTEVVVDDRAARLRRAHRRQRRRQSGIGSRTQSDQ
jgi:hypothetical protein